MSGPDLEALARWVAEEHVPETALHEAGHAVLMSLTEAGVEIVFLRSADEDEGLYTGQVTPANPLSNDEHQAAMVSAAGLVAEAIRRGESRDGFVSGLDAYLEDESEDFSGLCDERALLAARADGVDLERAVCEAWELLELHWPAVEAVAAALVAKWTPGSFYTVLTGDEVRKAMDGAARAEGRRR